MAFQKPSGAQLHRACSKERSERRSGNWSPLQRQSDLDVAQFVQLCVATDGPRTAWAGTTDAWTNGWLTVWRRPLASTQLGLKLDHIAFRTATGDELCWKEKQRLKDEIFGKNRMAIEIYPLDEDLVDQANLYHLWVFPDGHWFDFGLSERQVNPQKSASASG
jgi:hypothetical protein